LIPSWFWKWNDDPGFEILSSALEIAASLVKFGVEPIETGMPRRFRQGGGSDPD